MIVDAHSKVKDWSKVTTQRSKVATQGQRSRFLGERSEVPTKGQKAIRKWSKMVTSEMLNLNHVVLPPWLSESLTMSCAVDGSFS